MPRLMQKNAKIPKRMSSGGKIPRQQLQIADTEKPAKKAHRFRPGTVALREIRKYQRDAKPLLKKVPFDRLVRELAQHVNPRGEPLRFAATALEALREGTQAFLVDELREANELAIYCDRVTMMDKDIKKIESIRQNILKDLNSN